MLLYKLSVNISSRMKLRENKDIPPELFDTIKANHPLDILHPPESGGSTGCLGQRSLRESRYRRLWQISAFCSGRVKPESPRRVEGVLQIRRCCKHSEFQSHLGTVTCLDVKIRRITEDSSDTFRLSFHVHLLNFTGFQRLLVPIAILCNDASLLAF